MHASGRVSPILITALLLATAVGCSTGPDESQAQVDRRPAPTTPRSDGQGSYIQFESGWFGAAHLPAGTETQCTTNSDGSSRAFSAATSDFAMFDEGSARPGEDFSLKLLFGPTHIANEAEQKTDYMSLQYVDREGVHHDLTALDQLDIQVVDTEIVGAGFSASTRSIEPDSTTDVTVTGFVKCSSVTDGPVF